MPLKRETRKKFASNREIIETVASNFIEHTIESGIVLAPERFKINAKNRRARLKGASGYITKEIVADLHKLQKGKCAYCKVKLGDAFDVDHITALINGGTNERHNLQLLCAPCNGKKGRADPVVYAQRIGLLI